MEIWSFSDTATTWTLITYSDVDQNPDANGSVEPLERAPVKPTYRYVIRHDRRYG
jgi:hypothetical protein